MINLFQCMLLLLTSWVKLNIASSSNNDDDASKYLTVDLKDPWGYEAIKMIHNKMDDDQNGSIDRKESLKFIVKDLKIEEDDAEMREETFHSSDNSISVDELWENWEKSDVSKWSVDQTVDWLIYHVKLPQYAANFVDNHIDGSRLPRIAANPAFLNHILKITDPLDRQRLTLNAVEAVLFGVSSNRIFFYRYLKLILIAIGFTLWFVLYQRRTVQQRLDRVFSRMSNLHESRHKLASIQKELEKAKENKKQVLDETENLKNLLKSQSNFDPITPEESLKERENSLVQEISAARWRLSQVEQMLAQNPGERIEHQKSQLQRWLQITYEIENKNYNNQKTVAEAQLIKQQNQIKGKRKKSTRRNHSTALDENLKTSRSQLTELINEIEISRDKWVTIENLCGFPIRDNPGLANLQQTKPSLGYVRMHSVIEDSEKSEYDEEPFTPSPDIDNEFFPDYTAFYRPSSRTSEHSVILRNNSHKQLARIMSVDETSRSLRNRHSAQIDFKEQNFLAKSHGSTSLRRMLIRRSSSLTDMLSNRNMNVNDVKEIKEI